MMTEIAYVTAQVPSYVHNTSLGGVRGYHKMHGAIINTGNTSAQHDGFKRSIDNKVIFFTSLNNAMSGNPANAHFASGSGHFQTGTGDDRYPAGIACFGYNVTTVIRDVFNRGIKYSNLLSEPKNNPEDYVARADHSAGSEGEHTTQGWNSSAFAYSYCYMPYPFAQPHGKAGSLSISQLNDRWADSGRKIVSFTTTPVVRPMVLMGKGGKIMAVDKDEPGALAGVGYKIYSEFQTEREGGVAGYESIPANFV